MEVANEECASYPDPETGEIITVTEEERYLVGEKSLEDVPEWQREMLPKIRERKAAREYGKSWQMPFMEQVLFVYFGVRFGDWAWKKAGISSVMRQSQKSRATGLKSTIFHTNNKLKNNIHALIVLRGDARPGGLQGQSQLGIPAECPCFRANPYNVRSNVTRVAPRPAAHASSQQSPTHLDAGFVPKGSVSFRNRVSASRDSG